MKLAKTTLNLREGDMERLRELHPDFNSAGLVIRKLVAEYVDRKERERAEAAGDDLSLN